MGDFENFLSRVAGLGMRGFATANYSNQVHAPFSRQFYFITKSLYLRQPYHPTRTASWPHCNKDKAR